MAYRMEKTEVLAKAIRYATPVRLRAGDAAAHLLAAQYLTGVHYHWRSGIGITDAQKPRWQLLEGDYLLPRNTAKAIEVLTGLPGHGDNLPSRTLASPVFTDKKDGS